MKTPLKLKPHFNRPLRALSVLGGFFFFLSVSFYSVAQSPSESARRHGPPPEAFAACETANKGDVCTIEAPHKTIKGTCRWDRRQKEKLLCVPNEGRPQHKRKPKASSEPDTHKDHPKPHKPANLTSPMNQM